MPDRALVIVPTYNERFNIARLIPALLEGAELTIELALLTMAICAVWGLVVALT